MQIINAGVLLAFIITNPSVSAFKAHQGASSYDGLKRKYNFFLCSIYTHTETWADGSEHDKGTYLGILGNFFEID